MLGPSPWPSPPSSPPELTVHSVCRSPPTVVGASKLWKHRSGRTTLKLRYKKTSQCCLLCHLPQLNMNRFLKLNTSWAKTVESPSDLCGCFRWSRPTVQELPAAPDPWNERLSSAPQLPRRRPAQACPVQWRCSIRASPPADSPSSLRPGTVALSQSPTLRHVQGQRSCVTTAGELLRGQQEPEALIRLNPNPVAPNTSSTPNRSSPRSQTTSTSAT